MFAELTAKLTSAKTYCIGRCVKPDELHPGQYIPDPVAIALYNTAFTSLNTCISNYKSSIDFTAVFRCVTGAYTAMVTTIDPTSTFSSLWEYFGGDLFNEMINTDDEDWFTTTADTSFVDTYIMKVTVAISGDATARENLGMTYTQSLNETIFKSFFDSEIEIPRQTPTDAQKIRMIFTEGKLSEIITEYGLSSSLIPPYAHPNDE